MTTDWSILAVNTCAPTESAWFETATASGKLAALAIFAAISADESSSSGAGAAELLAWLDKT